MKHYALNDLERAMLETTCNEVSKANRAGSQWNIGTTADAHATGHALIETLPDGTRLIHWGTADEYMDIFKSPSVRKAKSAPAKRAPAKAAAPAKKAAPGK